MATGDTREGHASVNSTDRSCLRPYSRIDSARRWPWCRSSTIILRRIKSSSEYQTPHARVARSTSPTYKVTPDVEYDPAPAMRQLRRICAELDTLGDTVVSGVSEKACTNKIATGSSIRLSEGSGAWYHGKLKTHIAFNNWLRTCHSMLCNSKTKISATGREYKASKRRQYQMRAQYQGTMQHVKLPQQQWRVAVVENAIVVVPTIAKTTTAVAPATPRKTRPQQTRHVRCRRPESRLTHGAGRG